MGEAEVDCLRCEQTMGKLDGYFAKKKQIKKYKKKTRYSNSDRTIADHFGRGLAISMESKDKVTEPTYIKWL